MLAKAVGGEAWGRCSTGAGGGSPVMEAWRLVPSHLLCNFCFVMLLFKEQYRRAAPSTSPSPLCDSWDFTNQDCANGKYRGVVVPSPVSLLQGSWVGIDVAGSPLLCHQLWLLLI